MRSFVSIFTITIVAAASTGCMPTGRQVIAHRNLGRTEQREGTCVPRGNARTGVEVLGDGSIRLAVSVPCRQLYATTERSRERVVERSSNNATANMLMGGGAAVIGAGGLIGLGTAMEDFGSGWGTGEGCYDGGCDDQHESSNAGTITALVGAGMVVGGLVVAIASKDREVSVERKQLVDRRIIIESRPGSQPVLVRAPIGAALRVELDDAGRGVVRLPASLLAETDRALLASILAQPWTLVIEGRPGTWTPSAAQVQRLLGEPPVAMN